MAPLRKLLIPTIAAGAALAILLYLGFWQLDRLAWKEHLIEQVAAGVTADPVEAPGPADWASLSEDADYRHVVLNGHFLDGAVFYYIALEKPAGRLGGPGMMVYAPFETDEGWVVLINRGFVPQGLNQAERDSLVTPPEGGRRLTGLLRLSEKPNWTTPEPDPNDRIWFARDTDAMADVLGVSEKTLAPYSIDLDADFTPPSGLPQAGETIVRFKNDHLGYALTWFGLAATLIGVFLTYAASILWPRRKVDG
ncbi:SURF1 family protein [Roseibium sediminicola]|uniref:SURF1-like protein n=1 Tax=Roseibium sediminicola TaxID=2933272 RepID=A0ABT0GMT8_9HYPH|nr:SURF1 family protein [Roseibium sp. CAU 1639]MCK7610734.1 SURF1 family protein [Roseibium sp. CAU 1639]